MRRSSGATWMYDLEPICSTGSIIPTILTDISVAHSSSGCRSDTPRMMRILHMMHILSIKHTTPNKLFAADWQYRNFVTFVYLRIYTLSTKRSQFVFAHNFCILSTDFQLIFGRRTLYREVANSLCANNPPTACCVTVLTSQNVTVLFWQYLCQFL